MSHDFRWNSIDTPDPPIDFVEFERVIFHFWLVYGCAYISHRTLSKVDRNTMTFFGVAFEVPLLIRGCSFDVASIFFRHSPDVP